MIASDRIRRIHLNDMNDRNFYRVTIHLAYPADFGDPAYPVIFVFYPVGASPILLSCSL